MANILVWGKGRDILAGELPAGITTEEVDGLTGLQAALEGKGRHPSNHSAFSDGL